MWFHFKYFSVFLCEISFPDGKVQESLPKFRSLSLCSVNKPDTCFGDFKAVFLSPTLVCILHSASLSGSASLCSGGALPWKQGQQVMMARLPRPPFQSFLWWVPCTHLVWDSASPLPQSVLQRRYTNGQEACEKMPNTISHWEMQIKTARRYYFTPTGMAIIKKKRNVGKDVEKLKPSYTASRDVKWGS